MAIPGMPSLETDNPSIVRIMTYLDILQQWANIHESILERYESKKFFAFHLFTQDKGYAVVFTQLIGVIVQVPSQDVNSFISITGFEKLDQLLNNIKIKTLECLNSIYNYILNEIPNTTKLESPFLEKGLTLCPYFIRTLLSVASRQDI